MTDPMTSRRGVLRGMAALGCSAAAYPLMTRITLASAPWDARLIVIVLRGAMDGLDVVRPLGDPDFAALRPDPGGGSIDLDGFHAMHAGLEPLTPLWQAGELSFVHAVSTPYRDQRSHFEGQDLLEAGIGEQTGLGSVRDGWLNRLLQVTPGIETETGYAIGREDLQILAGRAPVANWSPETRLRLGDAAQDLLRKVYAQDPLFRDAAQEAMILSSTSEDMAAGEKAPAGFPERKIAEFAADRLRRDTRIAAFSLNGWDTHRNQARIMPRLLARLADTILTLKAGLGPDWTRTAVLAMTEFGRTARQNGTGGTDHGTGGAMLMAGGAIRGGHVHGRWPGLSEADLYARRDLMPTSDVRAHAGWVMRGLFGLDQGTVERVVFPGVDLGDDLRLIR